MKNQLKISAIPPYVFGLRNIFLTMLMGILCYPVFGQMSETKTENKPMINSLRTGTGEVISLRHIKLKSDINVDEFEKWVVEYFNPAWEGLIPGVKNFIAIGDTRGKATGEFAYFVIYDTLKTRDTYVPQEGKPSEWFKENYLDPNIYLHEELMKFLDTPSFWENYSSWVVLR
jgi:hypothetical protein